MAKKLVMDTVKQVLTAWTPADGPPLVGVYPNGAGKAPKAPNPYFYVQFPVANSDRTTHSRSYVEEGAARIVILAEVGSGTDWLARRAEEVERLFRSLKKNGIEFQTPTSPLMNDDNDNGNYFLASVVVPYLYHFDDPDED
ncbi:hypothetical protein ABID82_002283 [Methylobacterium sp. PvP062]|uniref:DUF3168 domain-containing protein n=1 Tax=Methylobacterium radiotolerans TaxID=31998 RepID=A0ABV2NN02_9HYPH|nr:MULTISPECIES: phage tail terminator-like protein [unclassified Methylobacterium]MBP2495384.1 hypothetical protein [Methylobacterium sp. PvP105]MBP2504745.1 hypothetical protein [Methylobacterium sp. PvP109]MCX7335755.1 phage tail terminator-like protein [Hyphomicrobiales bacterium]